ncbi:MAG: GNAT family N-acetyltransferase [Candidatus Eremiobacteraeota bacterium]|nr:GNAT family N-acetyltransferase [Candidatus Eremiobacteraeota bacterium]
MATVLDNPIWSGLTGIHASFAGGGSELKVYPFEMAPFAGVPAASTTLTDELLDETLRDRPFVYFVGTLPQVDASRFEVQPHENIRQMVCEGLKPAPVPANVPMRDLDANDVPSMLDLMSRVYPAYFRARTIEMGRYVGIHDGGELVAMAGLRMAPKGYREISGVCTDPRFAGRGYAGMLVRALAEGMYANADIPMLHMDLDNTRALRLYEALGFVHRTEVAMCRVSRIT